MFTRMKTFKWTLPTLPLTDEERDGNKGNARVIHHPSEVGEEDLKFANEWEKKRQSGLPTHLAMISLKVFFLFLLLCILAVNVQGTVSSFTLTVIFLGFICAIFLKIKSTRLIWQRSERRYQSIIKATKTTEIAE